METYITDKGVHYSKHLVAHMPEIELFGIVYGPGTSKKPVQTGSNGTWLVSDTPVHTQNKFKSEPYVLDLVKLPPALQMKFFKYSVMDTTHVRVWIKGVQQRKPINTIPDLFETHRIFCISYMGFAKDLSSKCHTGFHIYNLRVPTERDLYQWSIRPDIAYVVSFALAVNQ